MNLFQQKWDSALGLFKSKDYKSAILELDILEESITNEAIFFVKAQCMWHIGSYQEGIKYFEKAYNQSDDSEPLLLALVRSYLAHNKKKKAQKILDKVSHDKKNNQDILFNKFLLSDIHVSEADITKIINGVLEGRTINRAVGRLLCVSQVFGFHQQELKKINEQLSVIESQNKKLVRTLVKIKNINSNILAFNLNSDLLIYALKQMEFDGLIIEAGVFFGMSINKIAKIKKDKIIYGFDSFEGLPVAWNAVELAGSYSTHKQKPKIKSNVVLIEGWFKESMPKFIKKHDEPIAFLHVDCDIYSSTRDVFQCLKGNIVNGTVILFDDFFGFEGFEQHEWRALNEFLKLNGFRADFFGFCPLGRELAIKIIK